MKFLAKNIRGNFIKIKIENLDDLWWLNNLIEKGDLIKTKTYRRKKLEDVGKKVKESRSLSKFPLKNTILTEK